MIRAYVGIGSNIDPRRHIPRAVRLLREQFRSMTVSPVYACPAVGFDGPGFLNLVVAFDTEAPVPEVLRLLRDIEAQCGRVRGERVASRTIDLDLLLYGDQVIHEQGLHLPRDDILRYAFVLKPLADIAPRERHPENGRRFSALWADFDAPDQPLRRVALPVSGESPAATHSPD